MEFIVNPVQSTIESWLHQHPILFWILSHPPEALLVLGLIVLLLSGLFGAVSTLTQRVWLGLLSIPIRLLRGLGQLVLAILPRFLWSAGSSTAPTPEERLAQLLDRLENIRQEQDTVLQEVRAIVAETKISPALPGLGNMPKLQSGPDAAKGNVTEGS
ncbi:MAG TPA: hypothetical protein V6C88_16735 [Chroococcidiopsis sp.]